MERPLEIGPIHATTPEDGFLAGKVGILARQDLLTQGEVRAGTLIPAGQRSLQAGLGLPLPVPF